MDRRLFQVLLQISFDNMEKYNKLLKSFTYSNEDQYFDDMAPSTTNMVNFYKISKIKGPYFHYYVAIFIKYL
jgi:hypothetical protein